MPTVWISKESTYGKLPHVEISPNEAVLVLSDGTSHKIEVSSHAETLQIYERLDSHVPSSEHYFLRNIPLPRKPKVKKWIWEFTCNGWSWKSSRPLSEREYNDQPMEAHKVPETEIEVDET